MTAPGLILDYTVPDLENQPIYEIPPGDSEVFICKLMDEVSIFTILM